MKRTVYVIFAVIFLLSSCATTPFYKEPAIVDISDSKVVVQWEHSNIPGGMFATRNSATLDDVKRVGESGCANFIGKRAKLLSEVCGRTVYNGYSNVCAATNYLFACQDE